MLWEYPVYDNIGGTSMEGGGGGGGERSFEEFSTPDNCNRAGFILGYGFNLKPY